MRTTSILPRHRRPRKPKVPHLYCAEALRACELAAARVKCAGDDLTAQWVALAQEAANGVEITNLRQARSWCQVLEGRLKERIAALEQARQRLDEAWCQSVSTQGQAWPEGGLSDQALTIDQENPTWSLLAKVNGVAQTNSKYKIQK